MNPQLQLILQQAIQAFQGRNFDEADLILKQVLQSDINSADAVFELGIAYANANRLKESSAVFGCLQPYKNNDARIPYNLGLIYSMQGEHQLALAAYDLALKIKPDDIDTLVNKGSTCNDIKNYGLALEVLDRAIQLRSDIPEAWFNKAVALNNMKKFAEAYEACNEILRLKSDSPQAWFNHGVALQGLQKYEEAIRSYDNALILMPDYGGAYFNKGIALNFLRRPGEAIFAYESAIKNNPNYADAWFGIGASLNEQKKYDKAVMYYDKALNLNPEINWLLGDLLHARMKICIWSGLAESLENASKKVMANEKVIDPFQLLSLVDDPLLHKKASEIYIQSKYPSNPTLGPILKLSKKEKIRIAYFSPDFKSHPVSLLTAELFEIHDRDRFEVFAFSFTKAPIGDETNLCLRKGFDRFIDVDRMSDLEVAQLSRKLEIDIAIDLAGSTQHSRTGIFSYRAAPIQANWLGYPGTIGADFIDYIIADKTIIPESYQEFYSEKVAYLPHTYMVDDSKRQPSARVFSRQECGLPENTFVFCCFNNDYKFNPQVLDSWSRILLAAKNSVIWISENNEYFSANITIEFEKRGIDSMRVVFAPRVDLMADHLARYTLADLFLDTHPYNAHTTTVDSLKAGVPALTLMGESFASRVAASLLNAVGLPELITSTQEEYEALAIELAMNTKKLAAIKLKLANNYLTAPLFDTPLFTKNLEGAYLKMMERYQADMMPDHIFIV